MFKTIKLCLLASLLISISVIRTSDLERNSEIQNTEISATESLDNENEEIDDLLASLGNSDEPSDELLIQFDADDISEVKQVSRVKIWVMQVAIYFYLTVESVNERIKKIKTYIAMKLKRSKKESIDITGQTKTIDS